MAIELAQVERTVPLARLATPEVAAPVQVYRGQYTRAIPPHYQDNRFTRSTIDINLILVEDGCLVAPSGPQATFQDFYQALKLSNPALFQQILSPSGAAKAAATDQETPIKRIAQMSLDGRSLPGDRELYGWQALEQETGHKGLRLQLLFQGNGLYFNRGSVIFDGENLHAYPDAYHAEILESNPSLQNRERLAIRENSLMRPLLFFVTGPDGKMWAYFFNFHAGETYRQGMQRLANTLRQHRARYALAASPPLVIPNTHYDAHFLGRSELLYQFQANDVRHYLYCPYEGVVLLSSELGRAQSLQPGSLTLSISNRVVNRVRVRLSETLNFVTTIQLGRILDEKSYAGRYHFSQEKDPIQNDTADYLHINPLEGVYSHLLPFLTRGGRFGLIQTSGTRGNVTGNDGPTLRQLSSILRDLNQQALFARDPIIAAASGGQGNDVPNIVCRGQSGRTGLLHDLAPETRLDDHPSLRGTVTTPRVGIAVRA
jgi:hypothetical protein